MRTDRSAFKAEVYRRGRERAAARKRARKRMIVSTASLAVCLVMAVTLTPMLVRWDDIAKHDGIADDLVSQSTVQTKEEQIAEPGEPSFAPSVNDEDGVPEYEAPLDSDPDGDLPSEGLIGEPVVCPIESAEVYLNGERIRTLTEENALYDLYILIMQIEASESENGSSEDTDGDGDASCRIILNDRSGESREYIWKGFDWYLVGQDRHISLTAEVYGALAELLLE